jgi:O-methyltransferase
MEAREGQSMGRGFIGWMSSNRPIPARMRRFILGTLRKKNIAVLLYNDPMRSEVFSLIGKVKNERDMLLGDTEAYQIHMAVRQTAKVSGDIAEVGVYQGGSSMLICKAKGEKHLHLFDTFEGIPSVQSIDKFRQGQFASQLEETQNYLKNEENVHFYKGIFPDTAGPIEDRTFSFVHLDVDTYESTAACVEFFYPRMNTGAVMISHDYIPAKGVRKAFDEFFAERPEPVIEMSGTQCMIVKT